MHGAQPLWQPNRERVHATQMYAFMTNAAKKYGFANACVLSRAAKRHGLDDLYQCVIGKAA